MPRFRFTVQRMMIAVEVLAPILALLVYQFNATEKAGRLDCASRIRQVALGVSQMLNAQGVFPAGATPRAGAKPEDRWSWIVQSENFLIGGPDPLPNDGAGNLLPFTRGRFDLLLCPSNPNTTLPNCDGLTHFVGIAGVGADAPSLPLGHPRAGVFGYDRTAQSSDIKDGTSNTMMIAETCQSNGAWVMGGPATVRGLDPAHQPYVGAGRQFGGTHRGGANVAMVDGSVRFVRDSVDPRVFEAISTIAGGEKIRPVGGY